MSVKVFNLEKCPKELCILFYINLISKSLVYILPNKFNIKISGVYLYEEEKILKSVRALCFE